jgi:hypothetical protein
LGIPSSQPSPKAAILPKIPASRRRIFEYQLPERICASKAPRMRHFREARRNPLGTCVGAQLHTRAGRGGMPQQTGLAIKINLSALSGVGEISSRCTCQLRVFGFRFSITAGDDRSRFPNPATAHDVVGGLKKLFSLAYTPHESILTRTPHSPTGRWSKSARTVWTS